MGGLRGGEDSKCHLVCLPFSLCFPFPIATGRFTFQNGLLRMISVLHVHGGSVEVMGWGGGRGVYRCTSVIMARAARNHRSEVGRPLLSLLLGGRGRGGAALGDANVSLERPRSNCGACSISFHSYPNDRCSTCAMLSSICFCDMGAGSTRNAA